MGDRPLPPALLTAAAAKRTASANGDLAEQLERVRLESDTLYKIIGVIASAPDLGRVLELTVDLLTDATTPMIL